MALTLSEQLEEMHLGDHLCLVYEDPDEQMAAVVPYFKQGLERNEACIYITDHSSMAEVKSALGRGGIDVEKQIDRKALAFATTRESYVRSGMFDPDAMLLFVDELVEEALNRGFSGYRITGEMTWALGGECGCTRLIEYEAKLNRFFPTSRAMAICQYNRKRFSAEVIRDVLRTHPIAIIGDQVCPNLYFEDPEMVLGETPSVSDRVDWMIRQLKRFHSSEQRLKDSIRTRDEFLSIASHELKTPLTSLMIQVQLLSKAVEAKSPEVVSSPPVAKRVEMVKRQTKRLTALIDTLLDVSRVNSAQVSLDLSPVDVSTVVVETVQRTAEEAKQKGIPVHIAHCDSPRAELDRLRFEQVLSNLLSNALKYGEGKPVEVELREAESSFRVSVRDHGIGICPQDQKRIFTRFERAVPAQNIAGLGLGLYVANEVIRAHGGSIQVQSEIGAGSTFTVQMPMRRSEAKAHP